GFIKSCGFFYRLCSRRVSIYNDAINHTQIAHVCVINTHVRAGFNRGSDHFAVLVQDVTAPVKHVGAWTIGTVLTNDKSFDRLVIGRRPFLSRHFDDRSRYGYCLGGTCPLLFTLRLWLRIRHRRKQCAAEEDGNCFLHVMPPVDGCTRSLVSLYKGIPERVLHEI